MTTVSRGVGGGALRLAWLLLCALLPASLAAGQAPSIQEFPPVLSKPQGLVAGPDGNTWIVEENSSKVARMDRNGNLLAEFPLPPGSGPQAIVVGPDGNFWITEGDSKKIARMSVAGAVVEFPVGGSPESIAVGPDGNLWFTEEAANRIGKMDTLGTLLSEFTVPTAGGAPRAIAAAPCGDAALWFTEQIGKIARITTAGQITEPFSTGAGSNLRGIAAGPPGDCNLYVADRGHDAIVKVSGSSSGSAASVSLPAGSGPIGITAAPDRNLWFTENGSNKIGQMATNGTLGPEAAVPRASSSPDGITVGPDGNVWFSEAGGNHVGKVIISAPGCLANASTLCLNNGRFKVTVAWRVPSQGTSGAGVAVSLTGDTGYFWFFSANNVELIVKVVDGRVLNNRFWVFFGALSNVEYTITVTDTSTGAVKTYFNPFGQLTSASDTDAFPGLVSEPTDFEAAMPPAAAPERTVERPSEADAACTADATTLCLNNGRFQVRVQWSVPSQGTSGPGMATAITGDTGHCWFFTSNNIELIVKLVDGRAVNGKFWFFSGALTNVAYTITITDTLTGAVKTYVNPFGAQVSLADTSAF